MTAMQVMGELQARGVKLEARGDRLRFHPQQAVTGKLREALVAHKAEILRLLAAEPPSRDNWPLIARSGKTKGRLVVERITETVRCYNGDCGEQVEFTDGRGYCKRCGVFQSYVMEFRM